MHVLFIYIYMYITCVCVFYLFIWNYFINLKCWTFFFQTYQMFFWYSLYVLVMCFSQSQWCSNRGGRLRCDMFLSCFLHYFLEDCSLETKRSCKPGRWNNESHMRLRFFSIICFRMFVPNVPKSRKPLGTIPSYFEVKLEIVINYINILRDVCDVCGSYHWGFRLLSPDSQSYWKLHGMSSRRILKSARW